MNPASTDHAPAPRTAPRSLIPPGERVLADLKPHLAFIVLGPLGWILVTALIGAAAVWALSLPGAPHVAAFDIILITVALVAFRLLAEALDWSFRRYVLTDRRLLARRGIFRTYITDLPLERVQHLTLFRSIREKLVGAGTIGIATAGTAGIEMFWIRVSDYDRLMQLIREAAQTATPRTPEAAPPPASPNPTNLASPNPAAPAVPHAPARPLVLGLVGGVGAGKSAAAAALRDAGFLVVDSDREAKDALQRPDVKDTLASWWGPSILTPDRAVDRKAVADIVFADPAQRERLEKLIHPLVGHARAALLARAAREHARGVVIDAPLLLEAGLDRECDLVVFVDAPRALRLARVRATRGWSEQELLRREQAQLPLEAKRARAAYVLENSGDEAALRRQVEDFLAWTARTSASTPNPIP